VENGIEYRLENDIWYPNLKLKEKGISLGKYGLMRKNFLEEYHRCRFEAMLLTGELYTHCSDVEEQAKRMRKRLIKQYIRIGYSYSNADKLTESYILRDIILI